MSRAKSAVTIRRVNIMESTHATVVPDFSSAQSEETDNIGASQMITRAP